MQLAAVGHLRAGNGCREVGERDSQRAEPPPFCKALQQVLPSYLDIFQLCTFTMYFVSKPLLQQNITEILSWHWKGYAIRNLKERLYSNRCYIRFFFFFYFLVSSNMLCLQTTKKAYFWTDSFQHNTFHLQNSSQYLFDKHCTENNFMHSKATNDKLTERGDKNSMFTFLCVCFFHGLAYRYSSILASFGATLK